jgi:hypothetical protein
MPEANMLFMVDAYDKYIGAQLWKPIDDTLAGAKVVGRARDGASNLIRISHSNTLQDT